MAMESREHNACKSILANQMINLRSSVEQMKRLSSSMESDEAMCAHMSIRCMLNAIHQVERALDVYVEAGKSNK